ncbi:hypothetical protein Tco_0741513 [Tanacetum coccineum]
MPEDEQVLHDELKKMVTQELIAKAMDDASRQAFEEEKRIIASQKKAAQATSTHKLNTDRLSVSTTNTPYVSAASTPIGANTDGSSFVYFGGQIPIDASTLPNADLPTDPNMPGLEDRYLCNARSRQLWQILLLRQNMLQLLTVVGNVIKNPVAHLRTKHIEIRFHFIRDCYEKRLIEVIKIHTDHNVADLFTKGFDVTRFNFLVVSIRMLNL